MTRLVTTPGSHLLGGGGGLVSPHGQFQLWHKTQSSWNPTWIPLAMVQDTIPHLWPVESKVFQSSNWQLSHQDFCFSRKPQFPLICATTMGHGFMFFSKTIQVGYCYWVPPFGFEELFLLAGMMCFGSLNRCQISILSFTLFIIPYFSRDSFSTCLILLTMRRVIVSTDGERDVISQVLGKKRKQPPVSGRKG